MRVRTQTREAESHRNDMDSKVQTPLETLLELCKAKGMPILPFQIALFRPSSVTVHDEGYVLGNRATPTNRECARAVEFTWHPRMRVERKLHLQSR